MAYVFKDYQDSADYIKGRLNGFQPEILMILGSGIGFIGDEVENPIFVDYKDIPNFKVSTAPGHKGRYVFGMLNGKRVAVMQGRMHTYEGYGLNDVVFPIRVAKLLGINTLMLTNAAGTLHSEWNVGDVMIVTDHIKMCLSSPLTGKNIDEFGPRFNDMSHTYTLRLQDVARKAADNIGLLIREGVYAFMPGPQFETPAEIRALRVLGADNVGMSTVPEAIAAAHCGMEIVAFSLCTNYAAGVLDVPLSGADVNEASEKAAPYFSKLVKEFVSLV